MIEQLIALADKLDSKGFFQQADLVDGIIQEAKKYVTKRYKPKVYHTKKYRPKKPKRYIKRGMLYCLNCGAAISEKDLKCPNCSIALVNNDRYEIGLVYPEPQPQLSSLDGNFIVAQSEDLDGSDLISQLDLLELKEQMDVVLEEAKAIQVVNGKTERLRRQKMRVFETLRDEYDKLAAEYNKQHRVNTAQQLSGWKSTTDGDYCPDCFKKWLDRIHTKYPGLKDTSLGITSIEEVLPMRPNAIVQCIECFKFKV